MEERQGEGQLISFPLIDLERDTVGWAGDRSKHSHTLRDTSLSTSWEQRGFWVGGFTLH